MSVAPVVGESDAVLVALDKGLARLQRHDIPYRHAVTEDLFDEALASQLVQAFACGVQWQRSDDTWYSFSSASSNVVECLSLNSAAGLIGPRAQEIMRAHLGRLFARRFALNVQFSVHRLEEGQWIGTHHDSPTGGSRSHCLAFTFSPAEAQSRGGELALVRFDRAGRKRDEIIVGGHNSAVAIECSSHSFRRVGRVDQGLCYFVLCSFWTADAADETTRGHSSNGHALAEVVSRSGDNIG